MDPRGKKKERSAKNNLAAHSRKGEVQSRVAVLERGAHCSARQELLESVGGSPMHHLGARGQELGTLILFFKHQRREKLRFCRCLYHTHGPSRDQSYFIKCFPNPVESNISAKDLMPAWPQLSINHEIDQFRVTFFLFFQNESSCETFHMKMFDLKKKKKKTVQATTFSFQWFRTKTRFDREAKGNSAMTYFNVILRRPPGNKFRKSRTFVSIWFVR